MKVVWGPSVLSVSVQNPQDGWWVAAQERRLCALVAWWWARAGFAMLMGAGQKPLLSRLRRFLAVLAGPRRCCKWQGAKSLPGKSEEGGVCSQCLWQNELKQGMGCPALPVDCSAMPQFWEKDFLVLLWGQEGGDAEHLCVPFPETSSASPQHLLVGCSPASVHVVSSSILWPVRDKQFSNLADFLFCYKFFWWIWTRVCMYVFLHVKKWLGMS